MSYPNPFQNNQMNPFAPQPQNGFQQFQTFQQQQQQKAPGMSFEASSTETAEQNPQNFFADLNPLKKNEALPKTSLNLPSNPIANNYLTNNNMMNRQSSNNSFPPAFPQDNNPFQPCPPQQYQQQNFQPFQQQQNFQPFRQHQQQQPASFQPSPQQQPPFQPSPQQQQTPFQPCQQQKQAFQKFQQQAASFNTIPPQQFATSVQPQQQQKIPQPPPVQQQKQQQPSPALPFFDNPIKPIAQTQKPAEDLTWLFEDIFGCDDKEETEGEGETCQDDGPKLVEVNEVPGAESVDISSEISSIASEVKTTPQLESTTLLSRSNPLANKCQYHLIDPENLKNINSLTLGDILASKSFLDLAALPEVVFGHNTIRYMVNYMKRDYIVKDVTSPIFFITHPEFGEHMLFGSLSALKKHDMEKFYKLHPLLQMAKKGGYNNLVLLTSNPNFGEKNIEAKFKEQIKDCKVETLQAVDKDFKIIRKEFSKQCVKLFDKVMYGSGGIKSIPGFDMLFSRRWNKFMKHYHKAIHAAYLCGDISAYLTLLSCFWALTLHFKKENRCHDLSNVLCTHISRNVKKNIPNLLSKDKKSLIVANINLLFKPEGIMNMLKQEGWSIECVNREDIIAYRTKTGGIPFVIDHKSGIETGALQHEVMKTGYHAKLVLGWGDAS